MVMRVPAHESDASGAIVIGLPGNISMGWAVEDLKTQPRRSEQLERAASEKKAKHFVERSGNPLFALQNMGCGGGGHPESGPHPGELDAAVI